MAVRPRMKIASIPAPVGGLNARDSLAQMGPDDAVALINYMPRTTSVELRYGYSRFATGMTGQSETLMAYSGGSTTKMFSANSGGRIYDVSSAGAVGAADVSSLTNGRFQYINVANATANYLMGVNAADKARFYTGAAWAKDGDGPPYDITGVDSATCNSVALFKNRVWLTKINTLQAWYLPTAAIGGAATLLDLRAFAPHGGGLVGVATWTIDAGTGVDDYLVFLTNQGEVIVYQGTDPSSSSTFALKGVWWIGSPIGIRPFVKWAGDLLIICQDGVYPLSSALQSSRVNPRVALTNKIQQTVSDSIVSYGSNFGWQVIPFPKQDMLVLNVPVTAGNFQEQFVMNTLTGAWGKFQGWNANCFELYNNSLYFGSNTYVGKAWDTNADNGAAISGFILQAFGNLGQPGTRKRATAMRPLLLTDGSPTVYGAVNWDYDLSQPTVPLTSSALSYGVWDSSVWDAAVWSGGLIPSNSIQSVAGSGLTGAPAFKSSSIGCQLQLVSTDISVESGGFL